MLIEKKLVDFIGTDMHNASHADAIENTLVRETTRSICVNSMEEYSMIRRYKRFPGPNTYHTQS